MTSAEHNRLVRLINKKNRSSAEQRELKSIIAASEKNLKGNYYKRVRDEILSGDELFPGEADLFVSALAGEAITGIALLKALTEIKQSYIESLITSSDANLSGLQRTLAEQIISGYINSLEFESGSAVAGAKNFNSITDLKKIMADFSNTYMKPEVEGIGQKMLNVAIFNEKYYSAAGVAESTINKAKSVINDVCSRIGIDTKGNIIKGGYLSDISTFPEVQREISSFMLKNVSSGASMKELSVGLNKIIKGTNKVDGALVRYANQYLYDTINQADELVNKSMAEQADMTFFVYSGTIMVNTRCFCEKRNNKIFSVEDTANWKDDPALVDPNVPYDPLVDRGQYNCRHTIAYITAEMAQEMGYDEAEAAAIVNETCG